MGVAANKVVSFFLIFLQRARVDKTVLLTGYRIIGDGIVVYVEAWDEIAKELISNPSGGDESDVFQARE